MHLFRIIPLASLIAVGLQAAEPVAAAPVAAEPVAVRPVTATLVAVKGPVVGVQTSSPHRIFILGEPIRFDIELDAQAAAGLGDTLPVVIRQLRDYRMPDTPMNQWNVDLGSSIPYETVGREVLRVQRAGGRVTVGGPLACRQLGALRIEAEIAGKMVTLADYLHVLPPTGIPAAASAFCVNAPANVDVAEDTLALYARLGIRIVRFEVHMDGNDDGSFDWRKFDRVFAMLRRHDLRAIFIIGKDDWKHMPKLPGYGFITYDGGIRPETPPAPRRLDVFAAWCTAFAERGRGVIHGCEFFNEPWETGSISGLSSGGAQVRRMVLAGAPALHAADPSIVCVAGGSGANAMDSILPYTDVLAQLDGISIHTFNPQGTLDWQPAHRLKKRVWDTESWGPFTDSFGPYKIAHQMHVGMTLVSPLPYLASEEKWTSWGPWSATLATCQSMLDGMRPAGVAMAGRVPQALLFEGRSRAVAYVHGFPCPEDGTQSGNLDVAVPYRQLAGNVWQAHDKPVGSFVLAATSAVTARDLYGNPLLPKNGTLSLPVGRFGCWVEAADAATLRSALLAGRLEGVSPVEIAIHDLTSRPQVAQRLRVTLTNVHPISQELSVTATGDEHLALDPTPVVIVIPAGSSRDVEIPTVRVDAQPTNRYRVNVIARSPVGESRYGEDINVAVIVHGSPTIDGDLADWAALRPVPVILEAAQQKQSTAVEKYQKLPFVEIAAKDAKAYAVEVMTAWDETNFYLAARINDPTELRRDSNAYGSRGGETYPWPNQHVYLNPSGIQLTGNFGDCLQLGFNTDDNDQRHWDFLPLDHPLRRIYGWPDTDTEIEVLPVRYDEARDKLLSKNVTWNMTWRGWPESEVWRLMDPRMRYWHHAYPLNLPPPTQAGIEQDLIPGGRSVVRREGNLWIYEVAIPWAAIPGFTPGVDKKLTFTFLTRNDGGRAVEYTYGKSVSVANCLTFHSTWERKWSNEASWGLVE